MDSATARCCCRLVRTGAGPALPAELTRRLAWVCALTCAGLVAPEISLAQQAVRVTAAALAQPVEPLPDAHAHLPASGSGAQFTSPGDTGSPAPLAAPAEAAQIAPPAAATVLGLGDLEQIALSNNPSIARAQAQIAAARGNWVQVGLPPNFSWGYLGQQLGSGNQATQHALLIDGELVTAHKLRWNRAVAEQEILRAEQQLFAQQQRVLTDVRIGFYEALLAQRNLDLAEQLLRIARDGQAAADRLQRAGETSRVDLRQAQIEVFNAQNNLFAARQRHFAAWQTLRAVLGTPTMTPVVLEGDVESLPEERTWDETLARLLATSPEIAAAVAGVERARAALVRARLEPIPNIRLQGGVMQDQGIGGKTDGLLQMLLPLPLVNRNQGGIGQAQADLAAAELAVQQVELDLQNRLAPVYERYASAVYRARTYRESILPAAKDQLELVRRGYEAGEFPFLQMLNAQRTFFQTNQQYLQALLDLRSSAAEIDGLLLRGSLAGDGAQR